MGRVTRIGPGEPVEEEEEEYDEEAEELGEDLAEAIQVGAEAIVIEYEARRYEEVMNRVNQVRALLYTNQDDLDPVYVQLIDSLAEAIELLATPQESQYAEAEEEGEGDEDEEEDE